MAPIRTATWFRVGPEGGAGQRPLFRRHAFAKSAGMHMGKFGSGLARQPQRAMAPNCMKTSPSLA